MSAVYFDERAFTDKVMARVADEPTPTVASAAATGVRQLSPRLLVGVGWTAWHLATAKSTVVRPQMRIKSAALLSVMLLMLAMGTTFAAAGAVAVVQQVSQHLDLPGLTGPHRPGDSDPANHNGVVVPGESQRPDGADDDQPQASDNPGDQGSGVTDPTQPTASPDENGSGDNGNTQGDQPSPSPTTPPDSTGGGRGTHPSPTPTDNGQGDNGGGNSGGGNTGGDNNGGGKGAHANPTPTDNGQGNNDGGGQNTGTGNDNGGNTDQPSPSAGDTGNTGGSNDGGNKGNRPSSGNGSDHSNSNAGQDGNSNN